MKLVSETWGFEMQLGNKCCLCKGMSGHNGVEIINRGFGMFVREKKKLPNEVE